MTCSAQKNNAPDLKNSLAVVIGTGKSGTAAARLLHKKGARVRILEQKEENISSAFRAFAEHCGIEIMVGAHSTAQFAGASLVVPSPGVPVAKVLPFLTPTPQANGETALPVVMSEIELASRYVAAPIIGVTGTNGKTTTVSLCAAMLQAAGKRVFLGGNIGTPLADYVVDAEDGTVPAADVIVLELSSFQLQTCTKLHPKVAVLINLSENHLDYHKDMQEYRDAKCKLFAKQTADDLAVLQDGMQGLAADYHLQAKTQYFGTKSPFTAPNLDGKHNQANIQAAWLACQPFGVSHDDAAKAVAEFHPKAHRNARVGEYNGILFIDDSKATTVDSLRAALESCERPVHLLCGGKWKGGNLDLLHDVMQGHVVSIGLFGASREVFESAWEGKFPIFHEDNLDKAFARITATAKQGEAVLMSPATSSFDAYHNYKERGEHFCRLVKEFGEAQNNSNSAVAYSKQEGK